VMNAVAHIHIKPPRLTKQGFVARGAAAVAVAGGLLLGIRLCFHNHAPQQLTCGLAFHQQAADELGGDDLSGAGEEGLGEGWEVLGERGGYGSGLGDGAFLHWRKVGGLAWASPNGVAVGSQPPSQQQPLSSRSPIVQWITLPRNSRQ